MDSEDLMSESRGRIRPLSWMRQRQRDQISGEQLFHNFGVTQFGRFCKFFFTQGDILSDEFLRFWNRIGLVRRIPDSTRDPRFNAGSKIQRGTQDSTRNPGFNAGPKIQRGFNAGSQIQRDTQDSVFSLAPQDSVQRIMFETEWDPRFTLCLGMGFKIQSSVWDPRFLEQIWNLKTQGSIFNTSKIWSPEHSG